MSEDSDTSKHSEEGSDRRRLRLRSSRSEGKAEASSEASDGKKPRLRIARGRAKEVQPPDPHPAGEEAPDESADQPLPKSAGKSRIKSDTSRPPFPLKTRSSRPPMPEVEDDTQESSANWDNSTEPPMKSTAPVTDHPFPQSTAPGPHSEQEKPLGLRPPGSGSGNKKRVNTVPPFSSEQLPPPQRKPGSRAPLKPGSRPPLKPGSRPPVKGKRPGSRPPVKGKRPGSRPPMTAPNRPGSLPPRGQSEGGEKPKVLQTLLILLVVVLVLIGGVGYVTLTWVMPLFEQGDETVATKTQESTASSDAPPEEADELAAKDERWTEPDSGAASPGPTGGLLDRVRRVIEVREGRVAESNAILDSVAANTASRPVPDGPGPGPSAASVDIPLPDPDPDIMAWLQEVTITGTARGDVPKVILDGKLFQQGEVVEPYLGLRFETIDGSALYFVDSNDVVYRKSY